ncbi:MAG: hypothetical protein WCG06_03010 [Candidatus Omnitrophota bacterium]
MATPRAFFLDFISLVLVAVLVLCRTPISLVSCGFVDYNESGEYLYAIDNIYRHAQFYRDYFTAHNALAYYLPAIFFKWTQPILGSLRYFFYVGWIAQLAVYGLFVRTLFKSHWIRPVLYLFIANQFWDPYWSTRCGGFRFALGVCALGSLCFFAARPRSWLLGICGFFAGASFLSANDQGALCLGSCAIFLMIYHYLPSKDSNPGGFCKSCLMFFAGTVSAWTVLAGLSWFYGWRVPDPLNLSFFVERARLIGGTFSFGGRPAAQLAASFLMLLWAFALSINSARCARGQERRLRLFAATLSVYGFGGLIYSLRYAAGPQFNGPYALALLMGCYAAVESLNKIPSLQRRWIGPVVYGVFLIATLSSFVTVCIKKDPPNAWTVDNLRPVDRRIPKIGGTLIPDVQAKEIEDVYAFVQSNSTKEDALLGFPDLMFFNSVCDRRAIGRYYVPYAAFADRTMAHEWLESFSRIRPPVVLVHANLGNAKNYKGRAGAVGKFFLLLRMNYRLSRQTPSVKIFLKDKVHGWIDRSRIHVRAVPTKGG